MYGIFDYEIYWYNDILCLMSKVPIKLTIVTDFLWALIFYNTTKKNGGEIITLIKNIYVKNIRILTVNYLLSILQNITKCSHRYISIRKHIEVLFIYFTFKRICWILKRQVI